MKSIKNLIETLKELISEASQNRSGYENMRLIPVPVKTQQRRLPNANNNNQ
ncbi:MAG TPA: hypothetical protein VGI38_12665 [Puia sp.]|jgi:hypothetical protein